ncbi:hypothetical protein [Pseudonocardia nigra]|uniref:hypothetical protein n=1 Tax=Pseudonocardia nigra TaxID=1921578 RepID=UPI001C5E3A98|nr:hypothetical protein [Pseudonocardia nigra]
MTTNGAEARAADGAIMLDALLPVGTPGPLHRLLPAGPALRMGLALAGRPFTVARRGAGLAAELARIGLGYVPLDPDAPQHPLVRRFTQAGGAAGATVERLVDDAGLDPADRDRVRLALAGLTDVLVPTRPSRPAPARIAVGEDVAAAAGAVVLRTPVFELLHYLPRTEAVHDVPLLVVPPLLHRHYLVDLTPGRSLVDHLVHGGQQVLALSWRNPGPEHAGWDLDTYARAVLDALAACERITRTPRTSLMGLGAGGVLVAVVAAHLAATGAQDRLATLTFAATVLDHVGVPVDRQAARRAVAESGRTGLLDGRRLVADGPPAAGADPVRHWAADAMRMPAGLHRDLVDVALGNALATPGGCSALGTPLDLSKVDRDVYVVTGAGDPRLPWDAAYRSARLFGGAAARFVLSPRGPVAALLTPPADPDGVFQAGAATATAPERWGTTADARPGSWWPDHLGWLAERSGPLRDAPPELGGRGMPAVAPAPGDHVTGA